MRTDVHHHFVTQRLIDELAAVDVQQVGGTALRPWAPEQSLAIMDRYDIEAALLSVPLPLQFGDPARSREVARSLNEFGAECVAALPERFGLFAALPLPDAEGALAEIAYALDVLGADGVGVLSNQGGVYPGDPRLEPVFEELDRRRAVVHLHPAVFTGGEIPSGPNAGSPVPALEPSLFEFVFDTTRAIANLVISGTLKRHRNVKLIVSHAGGTVPYLHDRILDRTPILARMRRAQLGQVPPPSPDAIKRMMDEGLADARAQLERLYYDTAFAANPTVFGALRALAPLEHVLLGTDFPFGQEIGVQVNLAGLERVAGAEDRRAIEGVNAQALFPRLARSSDAAAAGG